MNISQFFILSVIFILYGLFLFAVFKLTKKLNLFLKNGIIGSLAGSGGFAYFIILSYYFHAIPLSGNIAKFIWYFSMPATWLAYLLGFDGERGALTFLFCILFYYAIIGALVGLIFTMIKEKRKDNRKNALDSTTTEQGICGCYKDEVKGKNI